MPLSENEEFELLALERERAQPQNADTLSSLNEWAKLSPATILPTLANKAQQWGSEKLGHAAYNAGGAVTDAAAKVLPAEGAAALGFATNVGVQAIPSIVGGMAGKRLSGPMESGARRLMTSAIKPSAKAHETGKAARAVNTMLQEGINPTQGGIAQVRQQIQQLDDQLTQIIANSTQNVDGYRAATRVRDLLRQSVMQANPQDDVRAVVNSVDEFLNHPMVNRYIPVQTAQELKRGTYRALSSRAYGEEATAAKEAQKQIARGLSEEISAAEPATAPLNQRMSNLLNVEEVAGPRTLMDLNRNPAGLGWAVHNPSAFMAWIADRSAAVKGLLARGMYAGREQIPANAARAIGLPIGAELGTPPKEEIR